MTETAPMRPEQGEGWLARHLKNPKNRKGFDSAMLRYKATLNFKGEAMKFPKEIYVKVEGDKGDEYLSASAEKEAHAEIGSACPVAVYQLVRIGKVTAEVNFK